MKTKIIKELGIKISEPIVWTKPYNEIVVPKGFDRKIKAWEMFWIDENEKYKDFVFREEGFLMFACEQSGRDKRNKWSRRLYRNWSSGLNAGSGNLLSANGSGRVVFVKELEKKMKQTKKEKIKNKIQKYINFQDKESKDRLDIMLEELYGYGKEEIKRK